MDQTKQSWREYSKLTFGDISPSAEAEEELRWFFNEAEMEVDQPSNFCALLSGMSPTDLPAVERRAEALHAAGKIKKRLQDIAATDAMLLAALYTERVLSRAVRRALGPTAAATEALAIVRVEHLRAVARGRTKRSTAGEWLEELTKNGDPRLAEWRRDAERACAIAVCAYERARGTGPSVVPEEDA